MIALTALIRLLLYPLAAESIRVQKVTALLQPKMKEIQEKYKTDKEKQAMLMMQLWKENKINPLSSFFFLLIQLPILWTLYRVFWNGFKGGSLAILDVPGDGKPFDLFSRFRGCRRHPSIRAGENDDAQDAAAKQREKPVGTIRGHDANPVSLYLSGRDNSDLLGFAGGAGCLLDNHERVFDRSAIFHFKE